MADTQSSTHNDATIYDPCLPKGEGHHECVGRDDEGGGLDCACTCHRGVVVINAHRPEADAQLMAAATDLLDALRDAKRPHLVVEDCWYSCPESGECCNDDAKGCTCGADRHNAAIDAAIEAAS